MNVIEIYLYDWGMLVSLFHFLSLNFKSSLLSAITKIVFEIEEHLYDFV
jgi:hypothetical protein